MTRATRATATTDPAAAPAITPAPGDSDLSRRGVRDGRGVGEGCGASDGSGVRDGVRDREGVFDRDGCGVSDSGGVSDSDRGGVPDTEPVCGKQLPWGTGTFGPIEHAVVTRLAQIPVPP
jgi:hypothetical protein